MDSWDSDDLAASGETDGVSVCLPLSSNSSSLRKEQGSKGNGKPEKDKVLLHPTCSAGRREGAESPAYSLEASGGI